MSEPNANIFKAIDTERRGTTFEEVVSQLREMIHRGELRPGDRLPPERDLAKRLGVSRPTLRAGISSLAAVGVLQPRRGAGTFVVEAEGPPALDSSPLRLMASLQRFTPAEMFEARRSLEMAIAALAAERATGRRDGGDVGRDHRHVCVARRAGTVSGPRHAVSPNDRGRFG
jgi:GntR family transcriptional repressor for pyruvate dehydrogenase complex